MLCRKVSGGDVHSSVTELERWGTSCRERRESWDPPPRKPARNACPGPLSTRSLGPGPSLAPQGHPHPVCCWARAGTHHMDDVEGEDLDAAHNGGECADDGGEDGQAADAEEQVLGRSGVSRGHRVAAPWAPPASPTLSATRMLRQSGLGYMVSISLCRLQEAGGGSERVWQQTHRSLSWGQGMP